MSHCPKASVALMIGAIAGAAAVSDPSFGEETRLVPDPDTPPTITVEQPVNPIPSKPGGPVILSMSVRLGPALKDMTPRSIIPEFHFIAPNGNAVLLHRDVVSTDANNFQLNPVSVINIPADAQKRGAILTGGWNCNQSRYYTTISAYILDSDGIRSNALKYTVHCNGG